MDWLSALEHLPYRLVVTDRKGRVLLLSGTLPGVHVGRSFLRLAEADEVQVVGRAAKRALEDGIERYLPSVVGADGERVSVRLMPFTPDSGDDHLLVIVGAPEERRSRSLPPARSSVQPTLKTARATASPTPAGVEPRGRTRVPEASELVVVAAGGAMPFARALEAVMSERLKTRAWPVSKMVDALSSRGAGGPESIETALDPTTRVLFIGDSPYVEHIRKTAIRQSVPRVSGWAIGGRRVLAGAVWPGTITPERTSDTVADLQFEMMEVVRKAMPVRRAKKVEVKPALKSAAEFLEQPASMSFSGDLQGQVRHHQLVMAIARFIQEGMDDLIAAPDA